jgi:signal transduction histidine kinase
LGLPRITARAQEQRFNITLERDFGDGIAPIELNPQDIIRRGRNKAGVAGRLRTGLGLSITYDIVTKAHDGTIAVDSEVDDFTESVVTLPRGMFANEGSRA